ncbi:MAG: glycosyltransferase family 2 protein [Magnetococcales bacterium]|nr:glycosyltransferase family 2 protein [Magnetococcales bacterium]
MFEGKRIALVIPAYNEARLIGPTLEGIPPLFDTVYVVDDHSPDNQNAVVLAQAARDARIRLLQHAVNTGPGGAIITGYRQASQEGHDITVVVGGDNQMNLGEVGALLRPVVDGVADYAKGNRFIGSNLAESLEKMPKSRLVGNWIITMLTKIASGCYKVMDVVDGYTVISKAAIDTVNWDQAWKGYGYPMDFLIRLNAYGLRVVDVGRAPIYLPGERQSQIKSFRYALRVAPMLLRGFMWRLKFKYVYRDFHPVFFFFWLAFLFLTLGSVLGGWLVIDRLFYGGYAVTGPRSILDALLLIFGLQFLLFGMFFDMEASK